MIHYLILGATVVVSILAFRDAGLKYKLIYSPYLAKRKGQGHRFISHALIHANWPHLLVNMWVFFMFGGLVENFLNSIFPLAGHLVFLALYIGGALFAALPALYKHKDNPYYNSLGASGAVAAVLFASILIAPTNGLLLFFIPMPAFVLGILYLVYEYVMDKRQVSDGVAHDAHYWGALFGVFFMLALQPELGPLFVKKVAFYLSEYLG